MLLHPAHFAKSWLHSTVRAASSGMWFSAVARSNSLTSPPHACSHSIAVLLVVVRMCAFQQAHHQPISPPQQSARQLLCQHPHECSCAWWLSCLRGVECSAADLWVEGIWLLLLWCRVDREVLCLDNMFLVTPGWLIPAACRQATANRACRGWATHICVHPYRLSMCLILSVKVRPLRLRELAVCLSV